MNGRGLKEGDSKNQPEAIRLVFAPRLFGVAMNSIFSPTPNSASPIVWPKKENNKNKNKNKMTPSEKELEKTRQNTSTPQYDDITPTHAQHHTIKQTSLLIQGSTTSVLFLVHSGLSLLCFVSQTLNASRSLFKWNCRLRLYEPARSLWLRGHALKIPMQLQYICVLFTVTSYLLDIKILRGGASHPDTQCDWYGHVKAYRIAQCPEINDSWWRQLGMSRCEAFNMGFKLHEI